MLKKGGQKPKSFDYDILCLGSGAGGGTAAILSARAGFKTGLVEGSELPGGQSPSLTCIPYNALLQFVSTLETVQRCAYYGINIGRLNVNWSKVQDFKKTCVDQTGINQSRESFRKNEVEIIDGYAQFIDPWKIAVNRRNVSAKKFIIATGSQPKIPEIEGLDQIDFLTYQTALDLATVPKSVFVIGGGETGCTLAEIFNACGSHVYLLDSQDCLLSREDAQVGQVEAEILKNKGVSLYLSAEIINLKEGEQKQTTVTFNYRGERKQISAEQIIVATGASPNTALNLSTAGVDFDDQGIKTNQYLQSSMSHIYAIGDVLGSPGRTPAGNYQAQVVVHNLSQGRQKNKLANPDHWLRYLALSPPLAACGMTEKELQQKKIDYRKALTPIHDLTISGLSQQKAGFIKVLCNPQGHLLGASAVMPQAAEIMTYLSLALEKNLTVADLKNHLKAFPTWSEAINLVCQKIMR